MSMAPNNMSMLEASFEPSGSGHRGNDNDEQGFHQENSCEKSSGMVHEKPAKESMFSMFEFPKSEPDLNAQETKIEKEKKKETEKKIKENEKEKKEKKKETERKTKENEKIEKEKKKEIERRIKENERIEKEAIEKKRKTDKKIKEEEKRIAKEKAKEMERKIQEDTKREREKINFEKKKIENEISQIKAQYKERQKRIDLARREQTRVHARDGQAPVDTRIGLPQEWRYRDGRAKYEKNHQIEQLKSELKALDLQLIMAGEEVLRFYQSKVEDEISKEQARERLRKSTQAKNPVAPQPGQTAQSGEEELTKKFTLPVVSKEVNSSMVDNPFYAPGELKYHMMGEWDSDTCKEWIYDSLENGLTEFEKKQLDCRLKRMPGFCGKRMFAATEEEWVKWLATDGLLIHDNLQKIAEMVKVGM
ncbi:uncharacterized protein EAE98_006024 [Botrytis deweyae]|uniref:Uncharacterized protein n=1 Tax=Botrytis deweyae TaxID=2478750 RepID=A0ABQ7ILG8_9HELO|nr:uncharacterized protein EAE98_006024 [Botrytis deweyae]KAF7927642.1 hypothetical protein EAE98_006024 [Botrytis deweyae]